MVCLERLSSGMKFVFRNFGVSQRGKYRGPNEDGWNQTPEYACLDIYQASRSQNILFWIHIERKVLYQRDWSTVTRKPLDCVYMIAPSPGEPSQSPISSPRDPFEK